MKKSIGFGARFLIGVTLVGTGMLWLPHLPQITLHEAGSDVAIFDSHDLGAPVRAFFEERMEEPQCSAQAAEMMTILDDAAAASSGDDRSEGSNPCDGG